MTVSGADIATRTATTTYDAKGQFPHSASQRARSRRELGVRPALRHAHQAHRPQRPRHHLGVRRVRPQDQGAARRRHPAPPGATVLRRHRRRHGELPRGRHPPASRSRCSPPTAPPRSAPPPPAIYDQLDRVIAADTEGFDGSPIRAETDYDALGRVEKKSRPYFVTGGTPKWTTYTYDALGRVRHRDRARRRHHHRTPTAASPPRSPTR